MTKTEFLQRDLGASAFLLTLGYQLVGLQKLSEGFYAFCFEDPLSTGDRDSKAFFEGAPANADKLLHNLRKLKSLLRAEKHQKNGDVKNGTYRSTPR